MDMDRCGWCDDRRSAYREDGSGAHRNFVPRSGRDELFRRKGDPSENDGAGDRAKDTDQDQKYVQSRASRHADLRRIAEAKAFGKDGHFHRRAGDYRHRGKRNDRCSRCFRPYIHLARPGRSERNDDLPGVVGAQRLFYCAPKGQCRRGESAAGGIQY